MNRCRMVLRVAAVITTMMLTAAAPIHAAHGHDGASPASTMHAACAICQMHAPVGTPAGMAVVIVEPDGFSHFVPAHPDEFSPATRSDIDACRAPPFFLAR